MGWPPLPAYCLPSRLIWKLPFGKYSPLSNLHPGIRAGTKEREARSSKHCSREPKASLPSYQHMFLSAFQPEEAARNPPKEGPVSHPHSGDQTLPPQRHEMAFLPFPGKQKSGLAWTSPSRLQLTGRGGKRNDPRHSQSEGWGRVHAPTIGLDTSCSPQRGRPG